MLVRGQAKPVFPHHLRRRACADLARYRIRPTALLGGTRSVVATRDRFSVPRRERLAAWLRFPRAVIIEARAMSPIEASAFPGAAWGSSLP
jgi:hypothetical protein